MCFAIPHDSQPGRTAIYDRYESIGDKNAQPTITNVLYVATTEYSGVESESDMSIPGQNIFSSISLICCKSSLLTYRNSIRPAALTPFM
ncbi:hypothetical protein AX774_g3416 [Zancudomyces culisetae]|uniref:Uncharacterized protein n=1 Tax=Zancudomyces culisetae TaxID=1213189 RepID=A0A1R1PQ49_ZANCU|nr:hypothetical protein AX774_g3416 [Zancudomyces culisetae]|eukprot:OMH83079.1 hypothetical protein AX774_g3416 [Zancudomyces culisetae]